jgi:hypothetical protein
MRVLLIDDNPDDRDIRAELDLRGTLDGGSVDLVITAPACARRSRRVVGSRRAQAARSALRSRAGLTTRT